MNKQKAAHLQQFLTREYYVVTSLSCTCSKHEATSAYCERFKHKQQLPPLAEWCLSCSVLLETRDRSAHYNCIHLNTLRQIMHK